MELRSVWLHHIHNANIKISLWFSRKCFKITENLTNLFSKTCVYITEQVNPLPHIFISVRKVITSLFKIIYYGCTVNAFFPKWLHQIWGWSCSKKRKSGNPSPPHTHTHIIFVPVKSLQKKHGGTRALVRSSSLYLITATCTQGFCLESWFEMKP